LTPPRLPPFWLIVGATWIGPFSLHVVIGSMPRLAGEFATEFAQVQLTLTSYIVGLSLGQLVYGPLADRFGRRPTMLAGLGAYVLASLVCLAAWSIEALIVARLLQGAAACAGMVVGRAIIRDCYARDQAASLLGYTTMSTAIGASLSPLASGIVDQLVGWRANFLAIGAIGTLLLACAWRWLNETRIDHRADGHAPRLLRGYALLLRSRSYLAYAMSSAFAMATWHSFVAGAPYVVSELLGRPTTDYGLWVLVVLVGYVLGNFLAGRLSVRLGGKRMIVIGQLLAVAGAIVQLVLLANGVLGAASLFFPMAMIIFASGLFLPNANAGALSVHPEIAGVAAGLTGFLQMTISALATVIVAASLAGSQTPVIAMTAGTTILSALAMLLLPARRGTSA
jgi:DHA1 family bicyclomycin/chloramphenicol resistance-like MFS transporter